MTQRLFILSPAVIFAGRVNQSAFTYPLDEITFDGVTVGAYTDIKPGMTVLLGTAAGSDNRGRQRVRKAAAANTLYVGRSSQGVKDGELNLDDNQYITVLDDRRVWAKIPFIDENGDIFKDSDIAYTDQTDEIPPKANIYGGAIAATIDGSDIITVNLNATASYPVADGATITGHSWDVDDGTITAGTGTSIITAEFPAGFRHVAYTATDSNGKTHTVEIPVYAHDPDDSQCVAAQIVEHRITQRGQQLSFRILEDIPISSYPDGTLVILWDGEPADENDRTNVKFWGWIQSEQLSAAADRRSTLKDLVIRCVDIPGRLATLPGFSQSIIGDETPASWLEMKTPNMDKFIDYVLRWHSTAFEVGFYRPSGTGSSYPFVILESAAENLWNQAANMAKALVPDYILGANRNGEIWTNPDPMLQDSRTATVQAALSEDDYTAINWERMRPPRAHWIWGDAIKADPTTISALFCTAPGQAPGQGEVSQQSGRQLAQSQEALNSCEGHRYARTNATHGIIPITMAADVGIEPANMTWITLTLNSSYSRRQFGFTAARGLPVEVNISYNYDRGGTTKTVEVLFEEETSGTAAVTYIPPEPEWEPTYEPPIDPPDPTPTTGGDGFGTNYFQLDGYIARTRSLSAASPSWADITDAITGTIYDLILDPYDPANIGYAASSTGFWKSTTLADTSPTWTQIRTAAQILAGYGVAYDTFDGARKISASINSQGFVAFFHYVVDTGVVTKMCCTITTDGGTSWSYNTLHSTGTLDDASFKGAADYLPHLVGGEVVLGAVFELQQGHIYFSQSTDSGATWSAAEIFDNSSSSINRCMTLHYPYDDNDTGQIIWLVITGNQGQEKHGLWQSIDGGANWTKIFGQTNIGEIGVKRHAVESFTGNRQRLFHWRVDDTLWLSTNGGTSWSQATAAGISGQVYAAGGFPYNNEQYYVLTDAGIFVSIDNGESFADKIGNWSNGFTLSIGGGATVPLWIPE